MLTDRSCELIHDMKHYLITLLIKGTGVKNPYLHCPSSRVSIRGVKGTRAPQEEVANVPTEIKLQKSDALVIVDVQNDFLPGGALAVPRGDEVVPVINGYITLFQGRGLPVIATRDWHPPGHCSFAEQGGPWLSHCVVGTPGARFAPSLALPCDVIIVSKDTEKQQNTYSGFEGADLAGRLQSLGSQRLFIGGLATDYCVLNTVRDALEEGFAVCLLVDAIRAVNVKPDDGRRAEEEMRRLGALPVTLGQVIA